LSLTLVRQSGGAGQLYGSVSARDIAEATVAAGFTVTRGQVTIDQPIKTIGLHSARISLHPEVTVTVTLSVAPSQDEAVAQLTTGAIAAPEVVETDFELGGVYEMDAGDR
jgi:large subunit ribosomal protein L9